MALNVIVNLNFPIPILASFGLEKNGIESGCQYVPKKFLAFLEKGLKLWQRSLEVNTEEEIRNLKQECELFDLSKNGKNQKIGSREFKFYYLGKEVVVAVLLGLFFVWMCTFN